jgi:phenylacetate-CoA ligase
MASALAQKLYWRSPYWVKCWMASAHARRSGRSRFGADYERIVSEIEQRDRWGPEQFVDYQHEQLRAIVTHAAANVPYYRRLFGELGIDSASIQTAADLTKVPVLEKQMARENVDALVDERLDRSTLVTVNTSGTTGTPLDLYRQVEQEAAALAYYDVRCHDVAGVRRRRNRSVSLGGHLVTEPNRAKPPFWVHNRHWNQLYMSSYHLAPQHLGAYAKAIRKFGPDYVEGYPSSVYAVANHIVENDLPPLSLKAAFTTAENLFDHQRDAIRKAFGCPTYSQYGCGEMVVFAAECEAGSMHLTPEFGIVEVLDPDGGPAEAGTPGDLVCTGLMGFAQPFIRYRLGDVGALRVEPCSCGRPLPVLDHIEGRIDAVLITRDGRRIGRLDPVFKGAEGIAEAQIVQDDFDRFRIRIVPGKGYSEADGRVLAKNLMQRTGEADIQVELVESIERTRAGKFKAVVCNLPDDVKNRRP